MILNGHAPLLAISGAIVTALLAGVANYVVLVTKIQERSTPEQVEHLIDLKTDDKYAEIIRRLEVIEKASVEAARLAQIAPSWYTSPSPQKGR
jgi:hypothetical protein